MQQLSYKRWRNGARLRVARDVYVGSVVVPVKQTERGFTLIEVMITLALLSTGLLGLLSMQMASVRGVQSAVETTLATNLASSALDDLSLVDYATLQATGIPGFPRKFDKQGTEIAASAADPYYTVNAAYVARGANYIDINVSTTWSNELNASKSRNITINGRIRQRGQSPSP